MSTNYYADFVVRRTDIFDQPYHLRITVHIGKASAGWRFSWQGYKDHDDIGPITTVAHWRIRLGTSARMEPRCYCERIYDENNITLTVDEMISKGTTWGLPGGKSHALTYPSSHNRLDGMYDFSDNDFS
jgi:hypothetical protein